METNEKYPQETDVYDVLEDNKFTARQYPNTWTSVDSTRSEPMCLLVFFEYYILKR